MHKKKKSSGVYVSSHKPMKKVCDENEIRKNDSCVKMLFHGRKPFITSKQKTGENDLHELLGNDCGYNEGTICVVNG